MSSSVNRKYPKAFYDDGLGDILEWIDDEVLIHSKDKNNGKSRKPKKDFDWRDVGAGGKEKAKKKANPAKIYGENEISDQIYRVPKKIKFELEGDEDRDSGGEVGKRLHSQVRGLINRLAAQTMPYVTSEFEKLYSMNVRSSVNGAIFDTIEHSLIQSNAIAKRKIVAELMLLVSYLSGKISQDIGASMVHRLVCNLDSLYKNTDNDEDKRLDNILICLVNLYVIGLISVNVVFEIAKRVCSSEDFRPKSIELLLLILRSVGFQMRKECPILMKQLILSAQEQCEILKLNVDVGSRIEFMMEALSAIKNNNVSKLGNYGVDVDKDTIESTLKSLIKRTKLSECLSDAAYDEILNSPNWYLLETRLDEDEQNKNRKVKENEKSKEVSSMLDQKICKALGLNKPAERAIFGALLRATDYVEASNIIIGFGLNHCSDAMLVAIHVSIHEKKYNPFYFNLINSLCKFNRKYKMAAKFSIQDKIRVLSGLTGEKVNNFRTLSLELIKSDAIPITILKAVEWADMSKSTKDYLCYLLESISELSEEENKKIMSKVDKRSSFAGAMRTFTNCFLKGCKLFQ